MVETRKRLGILAIGALVAIGGAACVPQVGSGGPVGSGDEQATGPELPSTPPTTQPPAPPAAPTCGPTALTSAVYNLTNAARAAAGKGALSWNGQLACLATGWSQHMAATGVFAHSNLSATLNSPPYSGYNTLGENILRGPASLSAQQMHNAWMNSPGHRANILSGAYNSIGIGVAYTGSTVYATQNFGG